MHQLEIEIDDQNGIVIKERTEIDGWKPFLRVEADDVAQFLNRLLERSD